MPLYPRPTQCPELHLDIIFFMGIRHFDPTHHHMTSFHHGSRWLRCTAQARDFSASFSLRARGCDAGTCPNMHWSCAA